MSESLAARRARLERELAELEHQERMERVLDRASKRVERAIDQAAEDIAKAARDLDDMDIDVDELKRSLRQRYRVTSDVTSGDDDDNTASAGVAADEGEPEAGGVERGEESPGPDSPDPGDGEASAPPPSTDDVDDVDDGEDEEEADTAPPPSHWASRPMFRRWSR